jgi:hypothetical protein
MLTFITNNLDRNGTSLFCFLMMMLPYAATKQTRRKILTGFRVMAVSFLFGKSVIKGYSAPMWCWNSCQRLPNLQMNRKKARFEAEAKYMRAYFNFILAIHWEHHR